MTRNVLKVDGRGGLVKDEKLGIAEQGPGEDEQLTFAERKVAGANPIRPPSRPSSVSLEFETQTLDFVSQARMGQEKEEGLTSRAARRACRASGRPSAPTARRSSTAGGAPDGGRQRGPRPGARGGGRGSIEAFLRRATGLAGWAEGRSSVSVRRAKGLASEPTLSHDGQAGAQVLRAQSVGGRPVSSSQTL